MKKTFLQLIDREIDLARRGEPAEIIAKMNSMEDVDITRRLYEASARGVKITLFVRGFCSLKPQIPGLSENINVYSILGRFLEHSRVFIFLGGKQNIQQGDYYIGSADWMYRNLHNRVEVITPIYDVKAKKKIFDCINIMQNDYENRWVLQASGYYEQLKVLKVPVEKNSGTHNQLMKYYSEDYNLKL